MGFDIQKMTTERKWSIHYGALAAGRDITTHWLEGREAVRSLCRRSTITRSKSTHDDVYLSRQMQLKSASQGTSLGSAQSDSQGGPTHGEPVLSIHSIQTRSDHKGSNLVSAIRLLVHRSHRPGCLTSKPVSLL